MMFSNRSRHLQAPGRVERSREWNSADRHPVARSEMLALALRFGLSSYDAAYLELALRLQCPVASQDEALRQAALACGLGWLAAGWRPPSSLIGPIPTLHGTSAQPGARRLATSRRSSPDS
jgi:hypothetical protein